MSDEFKVIPPTTKVLCPELGEGWTLTGITGMQEQTSVMFSGVRHTIAAKKIVEELLPNYLKQQVIAE
ncbi:hypothetical protein PSECIP111951_01858 [Pseudoalteromonas holothuriae]|uniref:Uncharacterized protein n=1 Tax=Pseudoalteromonas holothuriae TaxID=2963714 RepID=A0A9W4QXJ2_9GAMM|nr:MULTISPECIES: hypothetical protein [unclassified Pseudoalteromonas]CAH9058319.1 hypothetical protein PSECIP111854_02178 [Pseudoalteromonas sp. CIP111854]CAH9058348.1 hypothetical protein PSECIP111951_01858 [Pseudoalteromonas sp. CIP111951]